MASWCREVAAKARFTLAAQIKELDCAAEALDVCAKQLHALESVCEEAAWGTADSVAAARATAVTMAPLLSVVHQPYALPSFLTLLMTSDDHSAMDSMGRVISGLCAARCVVTGPGLERCLLGEANAIRVCLLDDTGAALDSAACGDVRIEVLGGELLTCEALGGGVLEALYGVPVSASVSGVTLHVTSYGQALGGSPWVVRPGLQGRCVSALPIVDVTACVGLAVSPDHSQMAVCSYDQNIIALFHLPSGEHIRTLGTPGAGTEASFTKPFGLCYGPRGTTILVAEKSSMRVQEVRVTGSLVRCIQATPPMSMFDVDTDGEVIVVAANDEGQSRGAIHVFAYASGEPLRHFGTVGGTTLLWCLGVTLTGAGSIYIADLDSKAAYLVSLDGQLLAAIPGTGPYSVAVNSADGDVVIAEEEQPRMAVLRSDGSQRLVIANDSGTPWDIRAVVYAGGLLYALDAVSCTVLVYS